MRRSVHCLSLLALVSSSRAASHNVGMYANAISNAEATAARDAADAAEMRKQILAAAAARRSLFPPPPPHPSHPPPAMKPPSNPAAASSSKGEEAHLVKKHNGTKAQTSTELGGQAGAEVDDSTPAESKSVALDEANEVASPPPLPK